MGRWVVSLEFSSKFDGMQWDINCKLTCPQVANFFKELEKQGKNVKVFPLEDVGHCPHDDRPEAAAEKILQWMDRLDGAELEIESDEETTI